MSKHLSLSEGMAFIKKYGKDNLGYLSKRRNLAEGPVVILTTESHVSLSILPGPLSSVHLYYLRARGRGKVVP